MRLTVLHPDVSPRHRVLQRVAGESALVAGVFCAVVAAVLVYTLARGRVTDPLVGSDVPAVKARLAKDPANEGLKEEVRLADERVRAAFFRGRAFVARGAWLLAGGAAVWAVALGFAKSLARGAYLPSGPAPVGAPRVKWAILVGGVVVTAGLGAAAMLGRAGAVQNAAAEVTPSKADAAVTVDATPATAEEFAKNWAGFRGSDGLGVAPAGAYPEAWDGPSGKNILWKVPVDANGKNSPVVWGDRLFLAAATHHQREVICYDAKTGAVLWRKPVASSTMSPTVSEDTGYAPSTVAVDGRRVFAVFPTGELACFDFGGKGVWAKSLGTPENAYGHASSLRVWEGRLFVQFDQGHAEKEGKSALYAFDAATGKELWKAARPVMSAWSTPIVGVVGGKAQVITAGNPWLMGHDLASGAEVWRAKVLGGEVAPSAAFAEGVVFVANAGANVSAVRADGSGDVTTSHRLWKKKDGLPDIASPLAAMGLVFTVTTDGLVTCFDAKKGASLWDHDFETTFNASPVLVGKKVYLLDLKGVTHVFEAAGEFGAVGKCELGEEAVGSPAFAGGRIYIRGKQNLYCIGGKP